MDRELRKEIVAEVKGITEKVQREHYELYHEEWVTASELRKKIGCFSAGWMKSYACTLPRTKPIVLDENNVEHHGSWIYPLHKITTGQILGIACQADIVTASGDVSDGELNSAADVGHLSASHGKRGAVGAAQIFAGQTVVEHINSIRKLSSRHQHSAGHFTLGK